MSIEATLETKLLAEFGSQRLKIDNDSKRHGAGDREPLGHYRFRGLYGENAVQRQRLVYACLAEELAGPIHALQLKCLTPSEYDAADGEVTLKAPPCGGGIVEPASATETCPRRVQGTPSSKSLIS